MWTGKEEVFLEEVSLSHTLWIGKSFLDRGRRQDFPREERRERGKREMYTESPGRSKGRF